MLNKRDLNKLISVIIPYYNAQQWIPETLQSCLDQSYRPIEIIIIDDGSTDQGTTIAETLLRQSNVSYRIIHIENGGPSRARNLGWRQAKGEWVQFLDADDLLEVDKIRFQAEAGSFLAENCAVIFSKWQHLILTQEMGWQPSGAIRCPTNSLDTIGLLKTDNFLATGSHLIRRSWLEKVSGFDEDMWLIEDVNLMIRIAIAGGQFHYVDTPKPLFYYRQAESSLSNSNQKAFIQACLHNTRLVHHWLCERDGLSTTAKAILFEAYSFIARASYKFDHETFDTAYNALNDLSPNSKYIPNSPLHLRWASQLLGYPQAEAVALHYRKFKHTISRLRDSI